MCEFICSVESSSLRGIKEFGEQTFLSMLSANAKTHVLMVSIIANSRPLAQMPQGRQEGTTGYAGLHLCRYSLSILRTFCSIFLEIVGLKSFKIFIMYRRICRLTLLAHLLMLTVATQVCSLEFLGFLTFLK